MANRNEIAVYIPDASYDCENWELESVKFRSGLEKKFGLSFWKIDIGTGASEPAFSTVLSLSGLPVGLIALFFLGKKIEENIVAWGKLYARLAPFLQHNAVFDRDGVAVLAIESIKSKLGKMPESVRLVGYQTDSALNQPLKDFAANSNDVLSIQPEIDRVKGATIHALEIIADGRTFRVFIQASNVLIVERDKIE